MAKDSLWKCGNGLHSIQKYQFLERTIVESKLSDSFTSSGKVQGWQCICHVYQRHVVSQIKYTQWKNVDKESGWCLLAPTTQGQNQNLGKLTTITISQPGLKPRPAWFQVKYSSPTSENILQCHVGHEWETKTLMILTVSSSHVSYIHWRQLSI